MGESGHPLPLGIRHPADSKGGGVRLKGRGVTLPTPAPLCYILRYPFLVTDTKIIQKAPSAPIYINFDGGARTKKHDVLLCIKTPFSACFFKFMTAVLWES